MSNLLFLGPDPGHPQSNMSNMSVTSTKSCQKIHGVLGWSKQELNSIPWKLFVESVFLRGNLRDPTPKATFCKEWPAPLRDASIWGGGPLEALNSHLLFSGVSPQTNRIDILARETNDDPPPGWSQMGWFHAEVDGKNWWRLPFLIFFGFAYIFCRMCGVRNHIRVLIRYLFWAVMSGHEICHDRFCIFVLKL